MQHVCIVHFTYRVTMVAFAIFLQGSWCSWGFQGSIEATIAPGVFTILKDEGVGVNSLTSVPFLCQWQWFPTHYRFLKKGVRMVLDASSHVVINFTEKKNLRTLKKIDSHLVILFEMFRFQGFA